MWWRHQIDGNCARLMCSAPMTNLWITSIYYVVALSFSPATATDKADRTRFVAELKLMIVCCESPARQHNCAELNRVRQSVYKSTPTGVLLTLRACVWRYEYEIGLITFRLISKLKVRRHALTIMFALCCDKFHLATYTQKRATEQFDRNHTLAGHVRVWCVRVWCRLATDRKSPLSQWAKTGPAECGHSVSTHVSL